MRGPPPPKKIVLFFPSPRRAWDTNPSDFSATADSPLIVNDGNPLYRFSTNRPAVFASLQIQRFYSVFKVGLAFLAVTVKTVRLQV